MVLSEEETSRLYRARRTVLQLLKDRGYAMDDSEVEMKIPRFKEKYGENMKREELDFVAAKPDGTAKTYVSFVDGADKNIGVKPIKDILQKMIQNDVFRAILVATHNLTYAARAGVNEASASKFHLEVFLEAELLVNISQHVLVPKHQLLTPEEKKDLLERYTVKETQLPRIQVNDPVARYYGLKRGDIVKITRSSEAAGHYITYRYAV